MRPLTTMQEYLDIPYTLAPENDHLHCFDLYVPPSDQPAASHALLCFVHGGGWTM